MKSNCLYVSFCLVLVTSVGFAQDCPKWGDREGALRFLRENKSHGTDADPACVSTSFATLSHDKDSVEALVGLLDFERSTKKDDMKMRAGQYPAINALTRLGAAAVPLLIKAVKEDDNELVRTNAAHALADIHRVCVNTAIAALEKEATRTETTNDQQTKLRAAQAYIRKIYPLPCKRETS